MWSLSSMLRNTPACTAASEKIPFLQKGKNHPAGTQTSTDQKDRREIGSLENGSRFDNRLGWNNAHSTMESHSVGCKPQILPQALYCGLTEGRWQVRLRGGESSIAWFNPPIRWLSILIEESRKCSIWGVIKKLAFGMLRGQQSNCTFSDSYAYVWERERKRRGVVVGELEKSTKTRIQHIFLPSLLFHFLGLLLQINSCKLIFYSSQWPNLNSNRPGRAPDSLQSSVKNVCKGCAPTASLNKSILLYSSSQR